MRPKCIWLQCFSYPLSLLAVTLEKNAELRNKLKEDKHSKFLMDQCKADAVLCRMSEPHLLEPDDVSGTRLSPGFCVEQGLKEDGSLKLRAIYDLSRSGVNA